MPKRRATHLTICTGIFVWMLSFFCVPRAVLAQETAPVTIILQFEEDAFGGAGGGGNLGVAAISASGKTSTLVFQELTLPRTKTKEEEAVEVPSVFRLLPTALGASFRYERVDFDNLGTFDLDGDIFSTTLQFAWDINRFSFGVLIPYDRLDLESIDADRIGAVAFGQYEFPISTQFTVGITANGNYTYTAIDDANLDDINTLGGGGSLALTLNTTRVVLGGGVSFQYNTDDTDRANDDQLLVKAGTNFGVKLGKRVALNLFGTWTIDLTDYDLPRDTDDDYFDLGADIAWNLTATWSLSGGYKKVLELDDFDSDLFFIGSLFRF